MKSVTKEEIAQAKQMDLLTYLASYQPQELVKVGRHEYKTRTHDSLRISENGKWNWCSQGFGGTTALNYLIRVQGMDFVSAVRHLCELEPLPLSVFQQVAREPNGSQLKRPFIAPLPDTGYESVAAYLRGRGIRSKVLRYCLREGLLYQTTRAGYKNCVFVGKDETGKARYACVRGCQGNFRGDVAGSEKRYGFCIPAADPHTAPVEVYEAPIDAMSGASLRLLSKGDWRQVSYLASGGLNYQAINHFLAQHPGVRTVYLCLDNDEPGRKFAAKLEETLTAQGYKVCNRPPQLGKDYNELLQRYEQQPLQRQGER